MKLSLAYSPCPNDTFIFDAIANKRIDLEGLEFEITLGDVQELNEKAFQNIPDVTKVSYHAGAYLLDGYQFLDSGSALGHNCGPLLISKNPIDLQQIESMRIGIPGRHTTAYFLLKHAFGNDVTVEEMLFSDIEKEVLDGTIDLGLIIHENRFTYADKGLVKILDLGEYWEEKTQLPIPLGGIIVKKSLPIAVKEKMNRIMRNSVMYAMDHPDAALPYMSCHAQEMNPDVMRSHVHLYVNAFTIDLGNKGREAVHYLLKIANPTAYSLHSSDIFLANSQ